MTDAERALLEHRWIEELADLRDEDARRDLFRRHSADHSPALVNVLYDQVLKLGRIDLERAHHVAETLVWLADELNSDHARAMGFRANGHVLYLQSRHELALASYQSALRIFHSLGDELEAARTINSALQAMAYVGRYDEAYALARQARKTFQNAHDDGRVARLDGNVANILYRQDRCEEALALYTSANQFFVEHGYDHDAALNLRNMAVCYISLAQFDKAMESYERAREYAIAHGMPLLRAEADYNIAYAHYLRGEYTKAIDLYEGARRLAIELADPYHRALCDLDQSELYLELNLVEESADLASRAYHGFRDLGMAYEAAKALVFSAIASSRAFRPERALALFDRARQMFVRESNHLWPALIDLYKAIVLFDQKEYLPAHKLSCAALDFFRQSPLLSKAALCELLLARLALTQADIAGAGEHCWAAFGFLERADSPAAAFQAHMVEGQVLETKGDNTSAVAAYLRAHRSLEGLRSQLQGEELKIAFLLDKLSVYESLVELSLRPGSRIDLGTTFDYIERAKSRSLADLIAFRVHALPAHDADAEPLTARVRTLREKLSLAMKQQTREELQPQAGTELRVQRLRSQAQEFEDAFSRAESDLAATDDDLAALLNAGTQSLDEIRQQLPSGALILEYYEARGIIYACVVGRNELHIVPAAERVPVRERFRYLQFQLSKFSLGQDHIRATGRTFEAATSGHLRALYEALIAPVRRQLDAAHLIVVPHGFLHYLPFHALHDGGSALIDHFAVSYAPSASVFQLCCAKKNSPGPESLVLGIPDPLAPHILEEAESVASALPNARLFIGDTATEQVLRDHARDSRFVHIATHGLFRRDNPLFSSIRLGKSDLSLFDLYQIPLSAEMVALSGCGTGLNVVTAGDELLGLVRGLLYAGANCVLATLWDVNDESTAHFMRCFYERLFTAPNKAIALQATMLELRRSQPHIYYWAPFVLIGKYF